jgi:HTH-type transcriptional regulator/antitoxin HipB
MRTDITTSGQLGPFLKRLRMERGLSQTALGNKIGLSQERISRIENRPEHVTFDQILTVLMALDATLTVEPRVMPSAYPKASAPAADLNAGDKDAW